MSRLGWCSEKHTTYFAVKLVFFSLPSKYDIGPVWISIGLRIVISESRVQLLQTCYQILAVCNYLISQYYKTGIMAAILLKYQIDKTIFGTTFKTFQPSFIKSYGTWNVLLQLYCFDLSLRNFPIILSCMCIRFQPENVFHKTQKDNQKPFRSSCYDDVLRRSLKALLHCY